MSERFGTEWPFESLLCADVPLRIYWLMLWLIRPAVSSVIIQGNSVLVLSAVSLCCRGVCVVVWVVGLHVYAWLPCVYVRHVALFLAVVRLARVSRRRAVAPGSRDAMGRRTVTPPGAAIEPTVGLWWLREPYIYPLDISPPDNTPTDIPPVFFCRQDIPLCSEWTGDNMKQKSRTLNVWSGVDILKLACVTRLIVDYGWAGYWTRVADFISSLDQKCNYNSY